MKNKIFISVICIGLLLTAVLCGVSLIKNKDKPANNPVSASTLYQPESESTADKIELDGKNYIFNNDITTVLVLGIDQEKGETGITIGNGGRSDVISLLILNNKNKTIEVLNISRDSMVEVDVYGNSGDFLFSKTMQITMQYNFGDSPKRSCWLAKNKVSELLYNIPINYTLSFTMDGIKPMVNFFGGVEVTIPEDYTIIDPAFEKNAKVVLNGEQAEQYIRYRDIESLGSNNERMKRHVSFVKALKSKFSNKISQDTIEKLQKLAAPYIESSLNAQTIDKLSAYKMTDNFMNVPGEDFQGEKHDEFYVDKTALKKMIVDLFYLPAS